MRIYPRNTVDGFTLIELSIVLVVIGLIIGGVLSGRDLIRAAQSRLEVAQIEKYNVAVNTFKSKYGCLPGDCANAVEMGFNASGFNGDGNGVIEQNRPFSDGIMSSPELVYFWHALAQAQLIDGGFELGSPSSCYPGIHSPPLKMPGQGMGDESENPMGGVWLATRADLQANITSSMTHAWFLTASASYIFSTLGVYLPVDAYSMDKKIDDGLPEDGAMRAITYSGSLGTPPLSGPPADGLTYTAIIADGFPDACVDDTVDPPRYHVTSTTPSQTSLCAPVIAAQF